MWRVSTSKRYVPRNRSYRARHRSGGGRRWCRTFSGYDAARDAQRRNNAELHNQVVNGEHNLRLAGPNSGFLPFEEVDE